MISEELLQSFIAEASDLLDDVEPSLIEYSRLEDVEERTEIVNRVFRHFHSIKGSAGFVGLHDIARLTHEAETLLEQFRKAPDKIISQTDITLLCRTVDLLRAIFASGGESEDEEGNDLGIDLLIQEIVAATQTVKGKPQGTKMATVINLTDDPVPGAGPATDDDDGPDATQVVNQETVEMLTDAVGDEAPPVTKPQAHPGGVRNTPGVTAARPAPVTRRRTSTDTARIINSSQMAKHDKMNSGEFAARYVSEANELLEQIEQSFLQAEQHPESSGDAIQEALRCLHSFKGNSGFMNLGDLERLSHRMESEVENNIGRTLGLDSQTFDVLLQMIDVLRQGVLDFSCGGSGSIPEADAYIAMMDEFSLNRPDTNVSLRRTATTAQPAPAPRNTATYRRETSSPTKAAIKPEAKKDGTDVVRKSPTDTSSDTEIAFAGYKAADEGARKPEKRTDTANIPRPPTAVLGRPREAAPRQPEEMHPPAKRGSTRLINRAKNHDTTRLVLRGETSTQEDLRSAPKSDNIVINTAAPISPAREKAEKTTDTGLRAKRQGGGKDTSTGGKAASDTGQKRRMAEQLSSRNDIRVDLRKLDSMLDLVGELVIAEAMVTRHPVVWNADNESLERAVHQLRRVASSLQDMATSVRMIPLAPTFRRMTRLVYDLSVKAGKMVDLVLLGEDTEVDRTVIERISDPLVHIIRNAIDHGIEPPEERVRIGKPETGRLTIEGHHEGGEVWIVITDDGRGLDREAILRRALSRGLIQGDGSDLTDNQIYHFIFEPGFSTAAKVTDISGRGFGMDVVKKNIEKLSGRIDIRTRPGEGTAVVMRIPLTLAIIDGMLVSSGNTRYIIPLLSIRESLRPEQEQIMSTPDGQEMVKIRDELIPIIKLDEIFDRVKSNRSLMDGILMIVEGDDGEVIALFADELLGQQETVIKGLSGWLKKSRGVSGCTILGDGEVGLILDIGAIVRLARQRSAAWM